MTISTVLQKVPAKVWIIIALVFSLGLGLVVFGYQERQIGARNAAIAQEEKAKKALEVAIVALEGTIKTQDVALKSDSLAYVQVVTDWNKEVDSVQKHGTAGEKAVILAANKPIQSCNLVKHDCFAELAERARLDSLRKEENDTLKSENKLLKKSQRAFISIRPNLGTFFLAPLFFFLGHLTH